LILRGGACSIRNAASPLTREQQPLTGGVMQEDFEHQLDAEALALFAAKGTEGGPHVPQAGLANGVKVRRVLQLTRDFAARPFPELRILDLGCGEGVYAIEAALRGAEVLALDARTLRMDRGAAIAARLGLSRLRFVQQDVRGANRGELGGFDVVWLLGLLYHLDAPEVFDVLTEIYALCDRLLIVDTLVSPEAATAVTWRDASYAGARVREHDDADPPELRASRPLKSIDNTFSFRFTREALVRALYAAGFTSVLECHAPPEPGKARDRITLVALRGDAVRLSTYPWVNDRTEAEIATFLAAPPALLHRVTWRATPPARPVTQEELESDTLVLGLHGPGSAGLKKSHHDDIAGDPYYLWSGRSAGPWAVSFRPRDGLLDLSRGGRIRWCARQSGSHGLRAVLETAAGEWFVAEPADGACAHWREFELDPTRATWQRYDVRAAMPAGEMQPPLPDLRRVRSFGVADFAPGEGSEGCARLAWLEIHGQPAEGPAA
jgi:2-polyprenyl-3-methyl-5-hydroxy-6-metoxy-1,4-benzoquinol methylase